MLTVVVVVAVLVLVLVVLVDIVVVVLVVLVDIVVVVFTLLLTRITKSVVTGQAQVTLELRNTPGKNTNQRWYTQILLFCFFPRSLLLKHPT